LRHKPRNHRGDFEAQITKPSPPILRTILISSMCTMWITHDVT
jgi:hypothetical protein